MRSFSSRLLFLCLLLLSSNEIAPAQPHVDTALKYVGHTEHGSNRSRLIDRWNRAVGAPLGSPWCGSYVSYCLTAGRATEPRVRTAWSRGFVTSASIPASKVLTGEYKVRKGDILIWRRSATQGHIGFSTQNWSGSKGKTVEGNTSNGLGGSQWNGGGVWARYRDVSPYNHFRIIYITPVTYNTRE